MSAPGRHAVACVLLGHVLAGAPEELRADADELSLSIAAAGAVLFAGEAEGRDAVFAWGGVLRTTYATHDWFAYELDLGVIRSNATSHRAMTVAAESGVLARRHRLLRGGVAISARLGVRYVPVFGIGVAVQYHELFAGEVVAESPPTVVLDLVGGEREFEVVGAAHAGFDYRMSSRWVAGARVRLAAAPGSDGYRAVESMLELSYYWYPR